jgi:hypothetical protein
VSRQRAHKVVAKPDFPKPVGRYERGRLRDRREVLAWMEARPMIWREDD